MSALVAVRNAFAPLVAVGALVVACDPSTSIVVEQPAPPPPPTAVLTSELAAAGNPLVLPSDAPQLVNLEVRAKVAASPHNYFRAVNLQLVQHVCRRFEPVMNTLPMVNLHGDAHVEQFAVTGQGVGLADFDDSATGPVVIDLVRFGTSVTLTAKQRGWDDVRLRAAFLGSYRAALEGSEPPPTPVVVARLREDFAPSHEAFLADAESRMREVADDDGDLGEEERGYARYVQLMVRMHPDKDASFFVRKRWGELHADGIGSATTERKLFRIEGPTAAASDDIILEAKEVRDMTSVDCINAPLGNAMRVVVGSIRFGHRYDPFLAVVPRGAEEDADDLSWWVQSWTSRYAELDIASLTSQEELAEVVALVGHQMAQAHTSPLPPPHDVQLRALLATMWLEHEQAINAAAVELSELTIDAHAKLVASLQK